MVLSLLRVLSNFFMPTGQAQENMNVAPEAATEQQDLFSKGRERYTKASESVSNAKKSVGGFFTRLGDSFNRLWERTKSKAETAAVGVLSTPEILHAGYEAADAKYTEFTDVVDAKISDAKLFVQENVDVAKKWTHAKTEQVKEFAAHKADQAKKLGQDALLITAGLGLLAAEKTKEKATEVRDGIKNMAEQTRDYAYGAVASAKMKVESLKTSFQNKINEIRLARLQKKLSEKLDAVSALDAARQMEVQKANDLQAKIAALRGFNFIVT